jgi:cytochrome c
MKIRDLVALAAGLTLAGGAAFAADGEALAKKNNCTMCHDMSAKKVGPPFIEVAAKYRGDKGAQAALEKKVRSGGYGNWGIMPMPATAGSVSDEDIKSLVQWVLSLK